MKASQFVVVQIKKEASDVSTLTDAYNGTRLNMYLEEKSCSTIQSGPLELVFFDFEIVQSLVGKIWMNLFKMFIQFKGLHVLIDESLLAYKTLWHLQPLAHTIPNEIKLPLYECFLDILLPLNYTNNPW